MTNEEREKAIDVLERKHLCMNTNCLSVKQLCSECPRDTTNDEVDSAIITALEALKQEPREHGEWIFCDDSAVINLRSIERIYHKCSKCGHREHTDIAGFNFCPSCGADMRKKEG